MCSRETVEKNVFLHKAIDGILVRTFIAHAIPRVKDGMVASLVRHLRIHAHIAVLKEHGKGKGDATGVRLDAEVTSCKIDARGKKGEKKGKKKKRRTKNKKL